jgi:hypothetical protein
MLIQSVVSVALVCHEDPHSSVLVATSPSMVTDCSGSDYTVRIELKTLFFFLLFFFKI